VCVKEEPHKGGLCQLGPLCPGLYLRTGHRDPGPGRHTKKKIIEIEVWYAGKKGCPRERKLREIYTENTVFCLLSVICVVFPYT
jgi:hypothetical protein